MATFQIHQDSEKENPHIARKEKTLGGKSNILQPSALAVAGVGTGIAGLSKPGRSNFSVLNSNTNNSNAGRFGIGGNKVQNFRDVNNKTKDENAGFAAAANKKSTATVVVPVVEQFKSFSVYEDQFDEIIQQSKGQKQPLQKHVAECNVEKENVFLDKIHHYHQQPLQSIQIDLKSNSLHKEFGSSDDYRLDGTPMSVSDVLSPMSVDRSQLTNSITKLTDDSNCEHVAGESLRPRVAAMPLPRNDRQRFFEVFEYQRAILEYFRESEKKHRPKPHYMRRQNDINYSMRTILVDWLVEVSEEYNLDTETLYLSVSYIDRFLSHMSVVRSKLQLVGTAAMYIAAKYEEIYPPDVGEFVFITDDTYNKAQVLRMEQIILKILAFDLCTPTINVFVNTYAVVCDIPDRVKFLTQYLSELSLLEADPYLRFHPSLISSACLALARYTLDYSIWSADLEDVTTYRLGNLKEVVLYLSKTHKASVALTQQAIQDKYKSDRYDNVSAIKPVEMTEEIFDEALRKYNILAAVSEIEILN